MIDDLLDRIAKGVRLAQMKDHDDERGDPSQSVENDKMVLAGGQVAVSTHNARISRVTL
jgi:hypothetical protein